MQDCGYLHGLRRLVCALPRCLQTYRCESPSVHWLLVSKVFYNRPTRAKFECLVERSSCGVELPLASRIWAKILSQNDIGISKCEGLQRTNDISLVILHSSGFPDVARYS
jgi:hypothetical protein